MKIRIGTIEDLVEVSRLWELLVLEEDASSVPDKKLWISQVSSVGGLLAVAEDGDKIVGFILCRAYAQPAISDIAVFVSHLFVVKEYRGKGTGTNLAAMAREYSKVIKAKRIEVATPNKSIGYWNKLGYKKFTNVVKMEV